MAWAYQPNHTDKTILLRNLTWCKLPFHMLLRSKDLKIQNYRHRFKSTQFLFPYLNKGIRCNHGVCFFYTWLNAEWFLNSDCLFTRQIFEVSECSLKTWPLYNVGLRSSRSSALSNSRCGSATGEPGQKHLPVVLPTRPRGSSRPASQNKMDSA